MDSSIFKKANEFLGAKSKHRKWQIAVTALAALVVITTAYFLSKPAQTLTQDPNCGIEEHTHTEECYTLELVCGYEDAETLPSGSESGEADGEGTQPAEAAQPSQTADSEAHQHGEDCYVTEQQLICGQEENAGHVHTDACRSVTENRDLTCGQEESAGHTHTDACKSVTESRDLTCGQEESAEHSHTDACYTVNRTEAITCGQEESAGHAHTDTCYTVSQKEEIICGQEEGAVHTHTEACYETVQKLVCDKTETGNESADSQAPADNATDVAASDSSEAAEPTEEAETETEAEPHVHTEECYAEVLTCKAEEHTHSDECRQEVFCGITAHTHGANCYDEEENLICEITEHRHEANCYKEPHCGITAHVHGVDCYDEEGNLTCDLEEHTHTDECYITNTYFCTEQIHAHNNDCYDLEGNLICGSADYLVHSHSESCYDKNERLICTLPEREAEEGTELHAHTEECYGVRGVLICGQTEVLSHDHDDNCRIEPSEPWFDTVSAVAYCGMQAHNHKDACKDSEGNVICGLEEHTHTEECYEETGYGCIHEIHVHEADCYDAEGNVICGLADYVLHTHDAMCYGMNGKLLCTLPEVQGHVHSAECYTQEAAPAESEASAEGEEAAEGQETEPVMVLTCTLPEAEAHEHTEACRDENGNLICGKLQMAEHAHTEDCIIEAADIEITQTYTGADFIVTATYNKKAAELPEDAQLFAARITEEGNEAYFAERAAQYEEAMGEEADSTMQALMQIGFLYEGAEAEPKAPVTIKVQFLDENGLPEGSPVTVVHFGENGNEMIQGTDAEKNSTTFQMNSFSEIALGWKKPVQTVEVDKIFTYEDDAFTVTFHVEGEAVLPTEEEIEEAKREKANETVSDGDAESTVSEVDAENGQEAAEVDSEGEVTNEDLEAVVEPLGEEAEEYEAALGYAEETGAEDGMLFLEVLSYGLTYQGAKLDLTGCVVTVEVTPTEEMIIYAREGSASAMAINDMEDGENSIKEGEQENVYLIALDSVEGEANVICDAPVAETDNQMTYQLEPQGKDNSTTIMGKEIANPKFTVQYYAYIETLDEDGTNALPVIDTSGKELPKNGKGKDTSPNSNNIKNIYVNNDGTVKATKTLTQMYKDRAAEYVKAPALQYFDALAQNGNYILTQIWVLKTGKDPRSTELDDWDIYPYRNAKCGATGANHKHSSECYLNNKANCSAMTDHTHNVECYVGSNDLHFTNRPESVNAKPGDTSGYIKIEEGSVIRLVHEVTENKPDIEAAFYDYDISSGRIYTNVNDAKDNSQNGITSTGSQSNGTLYYAYTKEAGINSEGNYSGSGTKLAFGNVNTGTSMGENLWIDKSENTNLLNKYNGTQNDYPKVAETYKGCTFGLVTSLVDGKIQYAEGVNAPKLFNDGSATGKSVYTEYSLKFIRKGDTYTLTAVNGTDTTRLESFNHPSPYSGKVHTHIWTNNFWPMDSADSYGTSGHDLKFGSYTYKENRAYAGTTDEEKHKNEIGSIVGTKRTFPYSDDGLDHNSYFGMQYAVEFELSEEYVGPLEYYFFGDDDMWVFLDGELVCDIGGVHSSVGEYVNLWDYLEKGSKGKHTLSFYYTERGASGSTCWMQFTLPSVTSLTPEQNIGKLQVEKNVTGATKETDVEFGFEITFKDANGTGLKDNYSYTKYEYELDADGNYVYDENGEKVVKNNAIHDVLIWNDSRFTLKENQFILIEYLPKGTTYEITEVGPVTVSKDDNGRLQYDEKTGKLIWIVGDKNPYSPKITVDDGVPVVSSVVSGTITDDHTIKIAYNNYEQFELPKTGGSGTTTLYALAGALSILYGAGLVYRKKFRERRAS